uniref:flippase n=1 Tax=Flavobacterium sp. TaxID=239 RepID=UPI00404AB1C8
MKGFLFDVLSVGVSKILMICFGLVTTIIIARVLGPEQNGIIASLLVYPSLFMTIGSLGIRQSTTYFIGKNIYSDAQIKTAIAQIWFFTTIFSCIVCFFLISYFSNAGHNLTYVFLTILPIPFSLFITYNSGIFLGKNEIQVFNRINWIPIFITFVGVCLLVYYFPLGISGYLIAVVAGHFVVFIILFFKNNFIQYLSLQFNWQIIQKMLSLGLIYAFSLLIINLNYKLDVILLDKLSTPYETGIYSKGASIIQYLWQIPMLLSTVIFARSAVSKDDRGFSLKVALLLRVSILLVSVGSLVLFFFATPIIQLLFGDVYKPSAQVMNFLLPGVLLLTIYKVMNMDLAGKGKPWISMYAMLPALIINIVLNIVLIPIQGANGAAIASTISYSVAALLFLFFYSKTVNVPIKTILHFQKSDFAPLLKAFKKIKK